jgi:type IV pilus assembly protein PilM
MGLFRRKRSRQFAAFDIGSTAIKILVGEHAPGDGVRIRDVRVISTNTTGKPVQPGELAAVLEQVVPELQLRTHDIRLAFPGQSAIIRVAELPKSSRADQRKSVAFQLRRYMPVESEDAVFDCAPLADIPNRQGWQKCLLVAVRREIAERYQALLGATGLVPLLVDVEPVAVINAYLAASTDFDRQEGLPRVETGGACLVHLGGAHADVCILKGHQTVACRSVDIGALDMVTAVAGADQQDFAHAAEALASGNELSSAAHECVVRYVSRLSNEIRTSLGYCEREFDVNAERIYVTGSPANLALIVAQIGERLGVPAYRFDPFVGLEPGDDADQVRVLRMHAPALAPVMGLAVRQYEIHT